PEAVHEAVAGAVERARRGEGPTLVEARCHRLRGHTFGDPMRYIPADEQQRAWDADPYQAYAARLVADAVVTVDELADLERRCRAEVDRAIEAALAQPEPGEDELFADVVGTAP
ncbi:MAG TPA: thiamine pyrophosphate-dependent enzyme, partial [Acidimicrobiales bacterium]|nr:thiamine pyrophosphate-dependent enzyme [Acidimicrobiales bacterium]